VSLRRGGERGEAEAALRVSEEELARERAEIGAELATTRRELEQTEPHVAGSPSTSAPGSRSG
jgi:hypothetical protein